MWPRRSARKGEGTPGSNPRPTGLWDGTIGDESGFERMDPGWSGIQEQANPVTEGEGKGVDGVREDIDTKEPGISMDGNRIRRRWVSNASPS